MFQKRVAVDKKKLLSKVLDLKKDPLTRLKYLRQFADFADRNELGSLIVKESSFIYYTFIDTFSSFDCGIKQRQNKTAKEDLDVILFVLEKILVFNAELIQKRWQFYSITFVMQKLLHRQNTLAVRQEGMRLFLIWYQIIADETDTSLERLFASLVPNLIPDSDTFEVQLDAMEQTSNLLYREAQNRPVQAPEHHSASHPQRPTSIHFHGSNANVSRQLSTNPSTPSTPPLSKQLSYPTTHIRYCTIEPVMPINPSESQPPDQISYYLECLLNYMVTQTTKIGWEVPNLRSQQELCFAFLFDMFKKVYLKHLFPDFDYEFSFEEPKFIPPSDLDEKKSGLSQRSINSRRVSSTPTSPTALRELGGLNLQQYEPSSNISHNISLQNEPSRLSLYQSIMIRWLSRFMRLDPLPGQDDLLGVQQRGERPLNDYYYYTTNKVNENSVSSVQYNNDDPVSNSVVSTTQSGVDFLDVSSKEFDIARTVAGTWLDNINVVHELFRHAFCNYYQPQSMKRVVNVYKEWICNASPDPISPTATAKESPNRSKKIGYTNFPNLLQVFVINSANAFVTPISSVATLEEQVEMCKRIMNIYRFMVMKICMNQATWEQLLNVMMYVTKKLFSTEPPMKKELSIGGRIAPAFFQTFIVSWIRANLYVHIPTIFWDRFQQIMSSLIKWRELLEEWSTTMDSLTRVLVKHVYDLNLSDLPLERPLDRRRRPKNMKSFSTVETLKTAAVPDSAKLQAIDKQNSHQKDTTQRNDPSISSKNYRIGSIRSRTNRDLILNRLDSTGNRSEPLISRITRSCSDSFLNVNKVHFHTNESSFISTNTEPTTLRKFRSEYLRQQCEAELFDCSPRHSRSPSPTHAIIDGTNLKDSNLILESATQGIDSCKPHTDATNNKNNQADVNVELKCVLAGGTVRGWTPENSIIMWRRMLGLFGNLNQINDPGVHFIAMRCLAKILNDFIKTRENLGVSIDNQATPSPPTMVPPYTYFSTWLFQATYLPDTFKSSKLLAYKMICVSSIRRHDVELSPQHYSALYQTLHKGLNSKDLEIRNVIIRYIGGMLFLINLPGCTILAGDVVDACEKILLSEKLEGPRDEALQLLSSTLGLHRQIKKLMILQPTNDDITLIACGDLRDRILSLLVECDKLNDIDATPKAISLCVLTNHIYQELSDRQSSSDLAKHVEVILKNVAQKNKLLCRTGCDMLRLLCDHANFLTSTHPDLVRKSIKTLCDVILDCYYNQSDIKESMSSLLLCLVDWCFSAGVKFLLSSDDPESLPILYTAMQTLESIADDDKFRIQESNDATLLPDNYQASEDRFISSHYSTDLDDIDRRDRTITNESMHSGKSSTRNVSTEGPQSNHVRPILPDRTDLKFARLACRFLSVRLLNYLGHYPLKYLGATSLSCCIEECEYLPSEQESDFQNSDNLCIFVVNDFTIITFIGVTPACKNNNYTKELSIQTSNQSSTSSEQNTYQVHIIVRDLCGKYAWECKRSNFDGSQTSSMKLDSNNGYILINPKAFRSDVNSHLMIEDMDESGQDEALRDDLSASSNSSRNRDYLEALVNQLGHCLSSDEVNLSSPMNGLAKKRNSAQSISNPKCKIGQAEEIMIALLTNQRFQELNHCDDSESYDQVRLSMDGYGGKISSGCCSEDDILDQQQALPFETCRQLIEQLGYMAWEKRTKIDMLTKNGRLLRELRNLDKQAGRETHKIAVIYVANGQEDKTSILTNSTGSRAFEDFVAGLGWEVNLANHLGFKGGLQTNKSTGETSPYFCNSSTEVMFHVSTRIPVPSPPDEESLNRKLRHLGNDEIHIVWSEHSRDYRRGIIPTEFGDVIIVVYPLQSFQGYFRIQIMSKIEVPFFGPLFNNSIVHQTSLSSLIRATAINASRAKRFKIPFFQSHFEERSKSIETIVQNQKERLPFEDFASRLYSTSAYMKKFTDKSQISISQSCPSPLSDRNRLRSSNHHESTENA